MHYRKQAACQRGLSPLALLNVVDSHLIDRAWPSSIVAYSQARFKELTLGGLGHAGVIIPDERSPQKSCGGSDRAGE